MFNKVQSFNCRCLEDVVMGTNYIADNKDLKKGFEKLIETR